MPRELSAIVVALLRAFVRFHIRWQRQRPRTILIGHELHSNLDFLERSGVDDPDHPAACFLGLVLHPDDIAHLQFGFDAVDAGSRRADVLRQGILKEWLVIGAHAPHSDL